MTYLRFVREGLGRRSSPCRHCPRTRTCSSLGRMGNPVIVDAVRTPLGKRNGGLAGVHPGELLGFVQREVLARAGVDPAARRAGGRRLRHPGRRAVQRHGPPRLAARRAALADRRDHDRRPVRLGAAGHPPDQRPRSRAGTIDVGIACGVESMSPRPARAPTWRRAGDPRPDVVDIDMPNQFEAADRIAAQPRAHPRRPRRLRPAVAAQGAAGLGRGPLRPRDLRRSRRRCWTRSASRPARRASSPATRDCATPRSRGWPSLQAGARGRPAHRRHLVADLRRRRRGAADGRGPRPRPRPAARGPASSPRPWSARTRTTTSTARSQATDAAARAHRDGHRRHRPVRGQRGVRRRSRCRGPQVHGADPERSTSTAAPSPSATRSARPAPGCSPPRCTSSSARDGYALITMCAGGAMATGTIIERL